MLFSYRERSCGVGIVGQRASREVVNTVEFYIAVEIYLVVSINERIGIRVQTLSPFAITVCVFVQQICSNAVFQCVSVECRTFTGNGYFLIHFSYSRGAFYHNTVYRHFGGAIVTYCICQGDVISFRPNSSCHKTNHIHILSVEI